MQKSQVKIYNTLSGKKDLIKPLKDKQINLFVCGPTVYDFSHIGHARTYIFFDCFVKYLRSLSYRVFYLQNITNIEDKIIAKAKEKGVAPSHLAESFSKEHLKDMKLLGITSVKRYAKATDFVKEIINQVERLFEKGYAYTLDDGIYFDIAKFKEYGKLSRRTALQAEDSVSRIDYHKNKKNRGDFCLWKFETHDGISWSSPFGEGRPGWHIEDTAITEKFFGSQYDIHGGGIDLLFPHHEAEIAQMETLSGKKPLARYWMHTGFLTIDGQKMSKSLNNFITILDFLKRYPYRQLRFWVAKNLWRSPLDYSEPAMIEARAGLEKVEEFLRKIKSRKLKNKSISKTLKKVFQKTKEHFYQSLADDFNTPKAFGVIFEFMKEANKFLDKNLIGKNQAKEIYYFFKEINKIFDIIDFKKLKKSNVPEEVKKLLTMRKSYRRSGDFKKADEMRKEIEKYGFFIEDTKEGPLLRKSS